MTSGARSLLLRRTIYQLKVDIGESVLEVTPNLVRFHPDVPLSLDVQEFSNAIHSCRGHEHLPDAPFASCVAILEDSISSMLTTSCPAFPCQIVRFLMNGSSSREGLRTEYMRVLALLTTYYEQQEFYVKAIETARRWVGREPYHEAAHRALIRLYAATGQQVAAKRQYDTCKRILAGKLGVPLDQETERLYQSLGDSEGGSTSHPQPQYTRNENVYLAYQTIGSGRVDVLQIGGFITHLEQIWEEPDLARFNRRLSAAARVILYDKRGVGLSDRIGSPASIEQQVEDAEAIMRAARSERVVIFAVSDGATVAIHLAAQHPQQVAGLLIYGGQAKGVRGPDYPWGLTPEQYQHWAERLVRGWGGPSMSSTLRRRARRMSGCASGGRKCNGWLRAQAR